MTKEALVELKKKIALLSEQERKERDVYLRGLATGEIQGPPTGYSSVDKPWLKWYDIDSISEEIVSTNIYDYFLKFAPDGYPLIEYYGRKYFKKDIVREVNDYMGRFSSLGIKEGDTVSFMMLDVPEVLFSMLALAKLGATSNLIKFDESAERINFMVNKGKTDYMFVSEVSFIVDNVLKSIELGSKIKEVVTIPITASMPKNEVVSLLYNQVIGAYQGKKEISAYIGEIKKFLNSQQELSEKIRKSPKCLTFSQWKRKYPSQRANVITNGHGNVAVIVYTGGTTGAPKAVEITNDNIVAMAHAFRLGGFDFDKGKTSLNILPPGPAYYLNATYGLMCCGVKVNMISNFTIEEYPKLIKNHAPNIFLSGPVLLNEIQKQNILDDTSFMVAPISGGDKYHTTEEQEFNNYISEHDNILEENHRPAIVHQGYGESESTAAASYAKTNAYVLGTVGIPLLNVTIGIFDYQEQSKIGKEFPTEKNYGEIGEICITGPTIMKGYKEDSEATNMVLRMHFDGKYWLHTDDLGHIDTEGRVFHHGRAKRMLTRAGSKIWLGALEDVIMKHPNIDNCCCVKMNDEMEREVPIAYVVLKDESMEDTFYDLDEMIRASENESYVPKYYIKTDQIPVTEVNKKVDFTKLEQQDILDSENYSISGKVISKRTATTAKQKTIN